MIIDMHVHMFPDALAPRARSALENTAGVAACTDLTEADTRRKLAAWGIDLGVVMPIATKPSQQRPINDWAAGLQHGNLLSFGTVHPMAPDAPAELRRLRGLGLRGVKLHPDYQLFEADDRKVYPLYEEAAALGLPVLFHAGFDPVSPGHVHCSPAALARVVRDLPNLTVIGAHLGGNMMAAEALEHLAGRNLYLDISMEALSGSPEITAEIIRRHDPSKILFASDCPWSEPPQEAAWVRSLPLPRAVKEDILWRNAAYLLKVQPEKSGT